jgi:hypothetical protein
MRMAGVDVLEGREGADFVGLDWLIISSAFASG